MLKIFIYSFLILSALNSILRTFSEGYLTELGVSVFDMSQLQKKVFDRQANIFEIVLMYLLNMLQAVKNIYIYIIAGIITLIFYFIK